MLTVSLLFLSNSHLILSLNDSMLDIDRSSVTCVNVVAGDRSVPFDDGCSGGNGKRPGGGGVVGREPNGL